MTKSNSTDITFVVDRSGSMSSIAASMKQAFQELIKKQRAVPGECKVSLALFDDTYELVYSARDISAVDGLPLVPRGSTALLDAVGRAIVDTGARLGKMDEAERPSQVLFVIVTDGQENASQEFTRPHVFDMITHQREKYSWEFVFLGANQDAIATATAMGISVSNSVTYAPDSVGTNAVIDGLSNGLTRYRSAGTGRMDDIYGQDDYDNDIANKNV